MTVIFTVECCECGESVPLLLPPSQPWAFVCPKCVRLKREAAQQAAAEPLTGGQLVGGGANPLYQPDEDTAPKAGSTEGQQCATERVPVLAYKMAHEVQSNYDRLQHATDLILQLPKEHDGRATWLMN